jgi:DNA (cytosine-5)-methyltransferase 1
MAKDKRILFDLFAGCGGLSQGFRDEGFVVKFANEFWKPAQDSYLASHPETILLGEDIKDLTNDKIDAAMKQHDVGKIDLIIGGPPCQGFSMAGTRKVDDPRNKLFVEFARVVKHLSPTFFVFENVTGLLTMQTENGERVIDQIVDVFRKLNGGYNLRYKRLNAADYGVPQERERVILIGAKLGLTSEKLHPKPTHAPIGNLPKIKRWFSRNGGYFFDLKDKQISEIKSAKTIEKLPSYAKVILAKMKPYNAVISAIGDLENIRDPENKFNHKPMNHTNAVRKRMALIKEGKNLPNDQLSWPKELRRKRYATVYKRLDRNMPACTLVPGHSAFPIHYKFNRSITVREAARLQTLPDYFKFCGNKMEQGLIVGNAVPTKMARVIARHVKNLIKKL